jgi:hypothetical protein
MGIGTRTKRAVDRMTYVCVGADVKRERGEDNTRIRDKVDADRKGGNDSISCKM